MKIVKSYNVQLWVGLKRGYDGPVHTINEVQKICQNYVNDIGWCVTVTPTTFFYVNGNEPGVVIGMVNYPRFESTPEDITGKAIELGKIMMKKLGQFRVSITTPDETIMLSSDED